MPASRWHWLCHALDPIDQLDGSSRNTLLVIAQVIMLRECVVNRALDQLARHSRYGSMTSDIPCHSHGVHGRHSFHLRFTSSLRRRGMGTMPHLRREPTRPKAASVPQAMDKYAPAAKPVSPRRRKSWLGRHCKPQ
ncbi:DUF6124 family protein [Pseudomonas corrugata]|uniref:DUF6124 family protein n=1 Tax=Pseudomonas corrugata TaxID=47879 RepID=UPI003AAEF7C6